MRSRTAKALVASTATAVIGAGIIDRLIELDIGMMSGEKYLQLPGDDLLPGAPIVYDRAITIQAEPMDVWPWIMQIGQDRAGFYSFTALENAIGCNIADQHTIVPVWQEREPGDFVPLHPDMGLTVAISEPGVALALTTAGGKAPIEAPGFDATWCFTLRPQGHCTRLHTRERYQPHGTEAMGMLSLTGIASRIMTWKMLRTIRTLAEDRAR